MSIKEFDSPNNPTPYPWLHISWNEFYNLDPCGAAKRWMIEQDCNLLTAWQTIEHRPDWMLWLLRNVHTDKSTLTRHQVEQLALMFFQYVLPNFLAVMDAYYYYPSRTYGDVVGVTPVITNEKPTARTVANEIDHAIGAMACGASYEEYERLFYFFTCVTDSDVLTDSTGKELTNEQRRAHRNGRRAIMVLRRALKAYCKFTDSRDHGYYGFHTPQYILCEIMDEYIIPSQTTPSIDVEIVNNKWYCDTIRKVVTPELPRIEHTEPAGVGQHDEESE